MNNVLAPYGHPTPPASPLSWDQRKFYQQQQQQQQLSYYPPQHQPQHYAAHHQQRYVPVAPEDRIGLFLGDSLQLTGIIGTGAYGVVYEAVDVKTSTRYAVKALSKLNQDGTPLDARQLEYQDREIRLHYAASAHPNVVSMLKIVDCYSDCLYVVLEYCPEGDLFNNITERGQFVGKDELARHVFLQVLDAVDYLHQRGIYHRDLKPENILVANHGETLKLADFGLATSAKQSEDYGCGSTFYMSPECLGQSNASRPFYYCAPNDVWSLGVILVNLTCGRNPWKQASAEDSTYRAYTRNPGFLKTILPLTDELDAILGRIFDPNPDQRITLTELRQLILTCPRLTTAQQIMPNAVAAHQQPLTPPAEAISPASSSLSSMSSARTFISSVDSLVSDDDSDIVSSQDVPEITTPPPPASSLAPPEVSPACHDDMLAIYDSEDTTPLATLAGASFLQQQQQQQLLPQSPIFHAGQQFIPYTHAVAPYPQQQSLQTLPIPAVQQPSSPLHQQLRIHHHHPAALPSPPATPLQQQVLQPTMQCSAPSKFPFWDWIVQKNVHQAQHFRSFHPINILPIPHTVILSGCH